MRNVRSEGVGTEKCEGVVGVMSEGCRGVRSERVTKLDER